MAGQAYNFLKNQPGVNLYAGFFIKSFHMSKESIGCEISIQNIWKIFGNNNKDALDAIQMIKTS